MNSKLKDLLESTSLPGLALLLKCKQLIVKIVWLLFTILLLGISIFYVSESIQTFYNYEVVTNIHVISEHESQFVTITFCMNFSKRNQSSNLNAILIECRFDQNNCSPSDFHIFEDPFNHLTCYRFNSAKNSANQSIKIKNSKRSGMNTGLSVKFNTSELNYLDSFETKINVFVSNVSSWFRPTRPYFEENPIALIKGGHLIQVEREFVKKLPEPHNNCIKQENSEFVSELFEYFIGNNMTYFQKDCLDLCVWEEVKQKCNCKDILGEYLECIKYSFSCILTTSNNIRSERNISKKCHDNCPEECDFINFKKYTTYLGLINNEEFPEKSIDSRENFISINAYYPRLEYTLINQIPKMNQFDLVSLAGGTLGLFIGFSFFTLVEIIQIFFELIGNHWITKLKIEKVIPIAKQSDIRTD